MAWNRYDNWNAVLSAARKHGYLYYHAPMDYQPHRVRVVRVFKNRKIRLDPGWTEYDLFTADRGHLDRFVRLD